MKPQDYQEIFGEYANRIIGQTPIITGSTFLRELEILAYVRQHSIQKFIAIDDDCRNELFNANCNWLFKTDYFRGLDVEATNNLIKFIQIKLEERETIKAQQDIYNALIFAYSNCGCGNSFSLA